MMGQLFIARGLKRFMNRKPFSVAPLARGAFRTRFALVGAVLSAITMAGCDKKEGPYIERTVGELYNNGMDYLAAKDYRKAAEHFDEVERQHPYSSWAGKSILMSAYASFMALDYERALATIQGYIQMHPGSPDVPYAYYLKALCFYDRIGPIVNDQKITEQAYEAMQEVVRRFPSTPYARDAKYKIALARSRLAGHDLSIAGYYQRQNGYVAALGRLQHIVQAYQETAFVQEALFRMVEIYLALGMLDQAQASAAVLGDNFPGSDWYRDAFALMQSHAPDSLKVSLASPR